MFSTGACELDYFDTSLDPDRLRDNALSTMDCVAKLKQHSQSVVNRDEERVKRATMPGPEPERQSNER
jgi:hypothetical protein